MRRPDRRQVLKLGGALGVMPSVAWASPAGPAGSLVPVRDTRLWVEEYGSRDAPALLYIHGGPGLGCFEFSHFMRELLAPHFRLILVDQRGVLRSDPWDGSPPMSFDLLIEDFEALRRHLRIERWTILGHSWGGPIALYYGTTRASVAGVIFENAVLDPHATGRNMLSHAAEVLETAGRAADARKVRALAAETGTGRMWAGMDEALNRLPSRQSLYVHDPAFLGFYSRIAADSGIPDERWSQGTRMALAMVSDPRMLAPAWNRISALDLPTLVVRGESDPATSPEELALLRTKPNAAVVEVPHSGHFVHVEQPHALAALITTWHRDAIEPPRGARAR